MMRFAWMPQPGGYEPSHDERDLAAQVAPSAPSSPYMRCCTCRRSTYLDETGRVRHSNARFDVHPEWSHEP